MNFHSTCRCRLIPMKYEGSEIPRYDIMSGDEHVGGLRFCPVLGEWILQLPSYLHVGITHGFLANIWNCLLNELSD